MQDRRHGRHPLRRESRGHHPVGTVASAHFAASVPNFLALEWHAMSVPFWNDMVVGPDGAPADGLLIRDGYLKVSEGPGLGVGLKEPVAR